jgi:NTE family protein
MKIGIALGSGAARGLAHIGIINALENLGLRIDVIAGCSIGAYVGSAYANGKLQALQDWASELTEWQVAGMLGVGLHRGGLIHGQKVFHILHRKFTAKTFADLQKPFAAVATDLYNGQEIWFREGGVMEAVRASCAIPALFPPVWYQNRWLVDGAVVNPVPVNICRQMGAEVVIAVNLSSDFHPQYKGQITAKHANNEMKTNDFFSKSKGLMQQWFANAGFGNTGVDTTEAGSAEIDNNAAANIGNSPPNSPSIIGVISSSLDILQDRVTRSRLAGEPPDILIEPQLRDFGMVEFYRAKELITEGKNSVDRLEGFIRHKLGI